jgi:hypothetical protein
MSQNIGNLTLDIYNVLDQTVEHTPNGELAAGYAMRIGGEFAKATLKRDKPREKGRLWASDLGKECMRQQWYKFNMPEAGAGLTGNTKFKFLYGNILEEAVLYMAEEAGHDVKELQSPVKATVERSHGADWELSGRIDAVIDGVLVDVKSTSSYGFQRYKYGIDATNDSFGYLWQLGYYKHFSEFESSDTEQGFVWIDKQNGHIKYSACTVPSKAAILERANNIADAVEQPTAEDTDRLYSPEPYGKSGNHCLPMSCSYCDFKKECWKDSNSGRGLRTFQYNHKPIHFTEIVREPKVTEIL